MTFKNLTIYLEGPICDCDHQDLSWKIERVNTFDKLEHHDLVVFCMTCDESIVMVHEDFIAAIKLDKKYPRGFLPSKPKSKALVVTKKTPELETPKKVEEPIKESNVISFLSFFKGKKKDTDPDTGNDKKPPQI